MFPDPSKVSADDLFGRFYLKVPGNEKFTNYYRSIDALRPFLYGEEWLSAASGYYINTSGNFDYVRLSYFTHKPEKVFSAVTAMRQKTGIVESEEAEPPRRDNVSALYGGEELRFRKFLSSYSPIALDIMAADPAGARRLMATFRWQITLPRKPLRPHFENVFRSQSGFYNSLSIAERERFWSDLSNWPDPAQVDWAHMMVNMVLPGDWNKGGRWKRFLSPGQPKIASEINAELEDIGLDFRIPAARAL